MEILLHRKTIIVTACILAVTAVAAIISIPLGNGPPENDRGASDSPGSSTTKETSPRPDSATPSQDTAPTSDTKPPRETRICNGTDIISPTIILTRPASVYTTALDAKNKTSPALIYQPGEYRIFKCYENMANITRTAGIPGGWIDPNNPYALAVTPEKPPIQTPNSPPLLNVMSLDNTLINWSHEYPTAFVREYNGYWNISPDTLYLTFDCGYDYNNLTSKIMDTLRAKGIRAVFFVTGDFMNDRPDLVRRMVSEGHIVGNHSYAHLNQPQNLTFSADAVIDDIQLWESQYRGIIGTTPSTMYFRPPSGAISRRSVALMHQMGYKTLMWGAAYKDWDTSAQPTPDAAMTLLRRYTTPGDIVLLHGISQTSSDILSQYIDEYRNKGFRFSLP